MSRMNHTIASLDLTGLESITDGSKEAIGLLLDKFLQTTDQDMLALKTAIRDQNIEAAREVSHRIKGSALIIGASELISLSQQLESIEPSARHTDVLSIYRQLNQCYMGIVDAIRLYQ